MKRLGLLVLVLLGACWVGAADCDVSVCEDAVFCSQFEEGNKDIWDDWDSNDDSTNLLMEHDGPCGESGNTVMRLRPPAGRGNADIVKELDGSYDKLYVRWYQQWEPGYDFSALNHGGGLHAGDRSFLGRSDYQPDGDDYMGAWVEPSAGSGEELQGRFGIYSYYRGMYQDCTNPDGACWGDLFPCMRSDIFCEKEEHKETIMTPKSETGRWYCIELMVDMGTPVLSDAEADGVQNLWVDGVEYGPFEHLWHRTSSDLKLHILWLNIFHHDADHSVEGIMLDNVVVSENRIGCLGDVIEVPEDEEEENGSDVGDEVSEVIVDNSEGSAVSGSWSSSSYYSGYYGGDYLYSSGASGEVFEWVADLPSDGVYEVYARWTAVSGRPTEVVYSVGDVSFEVSQEEDGGAWVLLGEVDLEGGENVVSLTSGVSSEGACADAVRFVLKSESGVEIKGDLDGDGVISFLEVEEYIEVWLGGEVSIGDLLGVVNGWRARG